jgi:hypothetical protein
LVQKVTEPLGGNGQSNAFPWPENAAFQDSKSLQVPARAKACHSPKESQLLSALHRGNAWQSTQYQVKHAIGFSKVSRKLCNKVSKVNSQTPAAADVIEATGPF